MSYVEGAKFVKMDSKDNLQIIKAKSLFEHMLEHASIVKMD